MEKYEHIDDKPIKPDDLYAPRELAMKKQFRLCFGRTKCENLSDTSMYTYIIDAIRRGMLPHINIGKGRTPYYKVKGSEAIAFIERTFGKRYLRGGKLVDEVK